MPQFANFFTFFRTFRASPLVRLFRSDTGIVDLVDTGALQGRLLYDKNGNLIGNLLNNKRQFEYVYDAQNRMIQVNRYNEVTGKEVLISFSYDALGRRTSKRVVNVVYEYIYSRNDVIEETQSNINPTSGVKVKKETRESTYGARGTDDVVSVRFSTYTRQNKQDVLSTTGNYYYEKNHLGSVIRITSSTGAIVDEYSYTVFGKAYRKNINGVYKPVAGANDSSIGNTRLFTGREYDREVSLYYLRARYYDPSLGRFVSRDPIGVRDNINLYTYVANSPVKYVDRMGLEKTLIIGFLGRSYDKGEVSKDDYYFTSIGSIIGKVSGDSQNIDSKLYYTNNFSPSAGRNEALKYMKENRDKYNKVIILGHSMGADNAVELSQLLNSEGINVDLLVTLDLVAYDRTTEIESNVGVAKNYYQRNSNPLLFLRGSQLSLADSNNTTDLHNIEAKYLDDFYDITNHEATMWHTDFWHTNIDELLINYISADIKNNF